MLLELLKNHLSIKARLVMKEALGMVLVKHLEKILVQIIWQSSKKADQQIKIAKANEEKQTIFVGINREVMNSESNTYDALIKTCLMIPNLLLYLILDSSS